MNEITQAINNINSNLNDKVIIKIEFRPNIHIVISCRKETQDYFDYFLTDRLDCLQFVNFLNSFAEELKISSYSKTEDIYHLINKLADFSYKYEKEILKHLNIEII